ncbi:MAG: hypothetical protein DHS20C15_28700 [Planctomycetota bacterium]|nr:MAG: hypothetical protein DHS20C15_28700 [Planctomycetota bacterium]
MMRVCRLLGCLVALGACGSEPPPAVTGRLSPQAHESLLAYLDHWRVSAWPSTDLPLDVAVSDGPVAEGARFLIRADDWAETSLLPALFRDSLALGAGSRVWRAAPRLGALPAEAEPLLEHEGRALEAARLRGGARLWRDPESESLFWWDNAHGGLVAFAAWPPGELWVQEDADAARGGLLGSDTNALAEITGSDTRAPRDTSDRGARDVAGTTPRDASGGDATTPDARPAPRALRQQLVLDRQARDGVLVPVPSELALDITALPATKLQVVTGVAARTYARDDAGQVLQSVEQELPIRFALEVQSFDGTRERLWEHTATAAAGFEEHLLSVAAFRDQGVRLRLLTEIVGDAQGRRPYAFWSGLELQGGEVRSTGAPTQNSVVIVQVDGLRADRLSVLGAPRATTPGLEAWAAERATVYEHAVSPANWTLPATASLLSGLAPHQHGALRFPQGVGESTPTLASRLRGAGFESFALSEGGYVSGTFGLLRDFDVFVQQPFQQTDWQSALDWLDARSGERPVFLYLHTYLVHAPWTADLRYEDPLQPYDGPFAGRDISHDWIIRPFEAGQLELTPSDQRYVRDLYDASVARFDEFFEDFRAQLDARLDPAQRVLVLSSDHGMELFDHGKVEYGRSLHRELLDVPLLIESPGSSSGARVQRPVSLLDVVPTVLDWTGLPVPPELPGESLRTLPSERRLRVSQHGATAFAVHFDGWKLLVDTSEQPAAAQLFDLSSDPGETRDLATSNPEWVRRLRDMLDDYLAHYRPVGRAAQGREVDALLLDELRDLGYLGGR